VRLDTGRTWRVGKDTVMSETSPLIEMHGVRKSFSGVEVLKGVDLVVRPGSVHALLGHNGAGKSTLIKILSGLYERDKGTISQRSRTGRSTCDVRFIHQDLGLIDDLTVAENLYITGRGKRILRPGTERRDAKALLDTVNMNVDPGTRVGDLTLGQKTLLAVARLLASPADVIVLDEVTAALTRSESSWLFAEMRKFTETGGAVILVSHRLYEIVENSDFVTVLQDGAVQFDGPTPDLGDLHKLLTDSNYERTADAVALGSGVVVLRATELRSEGVGPLNVELHAGEVLSLVGSLSSNLYAVAHTLAGIVKKEKGTLEVPGGHDSVAFLPEDRVTQGIMADRSVRENMAIASLHKRSTLGIVRGRDERSATESFATELDVKPVGAAMLDIGKLSGGNQQKALLGRAALANPAVYVLCEPTRGVDIGTRHAIYRFIDRSRSEGSAVVVITIDVDDALAVGDRVGLIVDGSIDSIEPRNRVTHEEILEKVS
jgi:ribose transport system ATP-binding protein